MLFNPATKKIFFTLHIISSLSWLGAVAVFLLLAIIGKYTYQESVLFSVYPSMHLCAIYIIVPLCFATLITGIVQAIGTPWGLFKHYWIVVKLILTLIVTLLLLLHLQPIAMASEAALIKNHRDIIELQSRLISYAAAGLGVLIFISFISVFKPWGKTSLGTKQNLNSANIKTNEMKNESKRGKLILIILIVLIVAAVTIHLLGGGFSHH